VNASARGRSSGATAPSGPARSSATSAAPFTTIKIRTAALIINNEEIALIRRERPALATHEHETRPDGSTDTGAIEWMNWRKLDLTIFPAIGAAVAALDALTATPHSTLLDAVTDRSYTWR
jgi:hypothetical protein